MAEYYLNIKILKKDKDITFKIKRFPVLIGKGRAKNIIPVDGDGVELKHGIFFRKGDKIFYEDTSRNGTRVNGRLIVKQKVPLIKGTNEVQIGRYRIIVQNTSSYNNNSKSVGIINHKSWFYLFIPIMVLLLAAISFFVYTLLFAVKTRELNDFYLEPTPLNPFNEIVLKPFHFREEVGLEEKIIYYLYFINQPHKDKDDMQRVDTIKIIQEFGNKTPMKFRLHEGLIDEGVNENLITVKLELKSDKYKFIPILQRPYLVSRRERSETKNGITLKTRISGMVFEYELLPKNKLINSIKVEFGDNSSVVDRKQDVYLYENEGKYKFKVEIELDNQKIQFERLVIVDQE